MFSTNSSRRRFLKAGALWIPAMPAVVKAASLSFFGKSSSGCNKATNAKTTAWIGRTSALPSQNTLDAANCFANAVDASSTVAWSDLIALNFLPNEGISDVVRYPYILGPGTRDPWGNSSSYTDINSNGLKGNGTSSNFLLGLTGNNFSSLTSAGMMVYVYSTNTVTSGVEVGSFSGSSDCLVQQNGAGNSNWDSFNLTAGQGRISVATPGAGFYSGQRTASNATNLYFANSTSPHSAIATGTGSGGTLTTGEFRMSALNLNGTASNFSDARISILAITNGLSASKSAAWFSLFQTLRQQLLGGFV